MSLCSIPTQVAFLIIIRTLFAFKRIRCAFLRHGFLEFALQELILRLEKC